MNSFQPNLDEITDAQVRQAPFVRNIPLLRASQANRDLRLKAESLQPTGSFKIRAGLAAAADAAESGAEALVTASAGNFAQGLTFGGSLYGLTTTVHVPDTAARAKVSAIAHSGATLVEHPFEQWWKIMQTRQLPDDEHFPSGTQFYHPVAERSVLLGNATLGLELAQDWPELDVVVVPFGGGGLGIGIAGALRASGVEARIVAAEVDGSAALAAALSAGGPVPIARRASFVDGIGSTRVLDEMWPLIQTNFDSSVVVSVDECRAAVRDLAMRHKLVVEGAAGAAFAVARKPEFAGARIAVILSGSNIDPLVLAEIIAEGA